MSTPALEARFRAVLETVGSATADRWVVAVSGGLDSVVLLHLLRFAAPPSAGLLVAHLDHGMRPESGDDARWVRGLAASWGLEVHTARLSDVPASEVEAREARHAFLEAVRAAEGARLVLTAHHADDQAETVLFRALRGTGQVGLAGMATRRDLVFRPLLSFWRDELEAYAHAHQITWREDATNTSLGYARNALRHSVLPDIERLVAPGARRALVRLADLARDDEAGWASILPDLLAPLRVEQSEGAVWADRSGLAALHPAVCARVLRAWVAGQGGSLDESTTRRAVDFVREARSGQALDLGRGLRVRVELDRVGVVVPQRHAADRPLTIPDLGPGVGSALLSGREIPVVWGPGGSVSGVRSVDFDAGLLRFPLLVRGREPGDRIRLRAEGKAITKKVKKLLLEKRIPGPERGSVPLLLDAGGDVLWIPGIARADHPPGSGRALSIGVG